MSETADDFCPIFERQGGSCTALESHATRVQFDFDEGHRSQAVARRLTAMGSARRDRG
ncbi:MAG: hypothetical protein NTY19_25975 [Planctomycetota bacterium]|nr:hypothetical protein [Planctomycetota bacterium]